MAVISKDLGAVTAYAAAVNRGYTGTKEEFETLMASYATVAQQAAESAGNASQSATNASQSAQNAETAKGTAQQAATDAQTAQASAQGYAQSAQQSAQSASQSAQSAESAKNTAVNTVDGFAAGAQQALDSVNQAGVNWKSLAQAHALDSEAWAVGKRDGEDVGSSDPAYHNNAKYYAEHGGASAQTATEAAQTATAKASEAQASAEAAAESARTLTIDATLTQSGQAADAKAVGDEIDAIADKETVESKNLFNPNAEGVKTGYYLGTSGNPTPLAGWNISDFIPVAGLTAVVASVWKADDTYLTFGMLSFLHTYNAEKRHIAKVWDTSTNGIYTVAENVEYIKFCWQPNNELSSGRKLMVEAGDTRSSAYEEYFAPYITATIKSDAFAENSITESKLSTELQNKIDSLVPTTSDDIVCWGDSLTYSQYSENTKYPARLAELTGRAVKNFGMPGANSMDISGLQGGMPIYLSPFTLPASTSRVEVTLIDANGYSNYIGLLHHMPRAGWVNDIQAMNNSWLVDGIPVMLIYASGKMYLYRLTSADEQTVFDRPVKLTSVHDFAKKQIQIFWVGTNDAPTTAEKAKRTADVIKNMVDYYGGEKYLVLGMTVKSYADAANDLFGQYFGNHYVDVKDYLIKYGLSDNNLSPTEQDDTDINNATVPASLRHDSVHFNDFGYTAVANCVYQHGKDLGYWN